MCGIAGIISRDREDASARLSVLLQHQAHRGPDHVGTYQDAFFGVHLGHNRLAIHDLSPAGNQPMLTDDQKNVLVFNGEIYNYLGIKDTIPGVPWKGASDTEVLLNGLVLHGPRLATFLRSLKGMFSFAFYDKESRRLVLARDPMGEKPLYYGFAGNSFIFGSDANALYQAFSDKLSINHSILADYLRYGYVPAPHTGFKELNQLMPGHYLSIDLRNLAPGVKLDPRPYWFLPDRQLLKYSPKDFTAAVEDGETLLRKVIKDEMSSDVPLGAFLSGGIDSSLIVALMQTQSSRNVHTFTIGFDVPEFDESSFARDVSKHLGTEHTEFFVTERDALDVVPLLPKMFGEPFADSSQIPTYLVSKLARQHVTVSLSGDAGDELFGGYSRYFAYLKVNPYMRFGAPKLLSRILRLAGAIPDTHLDRILTALGRSISGHALSATKLHKLSLILDAVSEKGLYTSLLSQWDSPQNACLVAKELVTPRHFQALDPLHNICLQDIQGYLPNDILTKVDRSTMAVSLESRAPFLHTDVVEWAWSLPSSFKVGGGKGKLVLREILKRHVPESLFDRPKKGFGVPLGKWLRGDLREWSDGLLDPKLLEAQGFYAPAVLDKWSEHRSGKQDWQRYLWPVLMWMAWSRHLSESRNG